MGPGIGRVFEAGMRWGQGHGEMAGKGRMPNNTE